MFKKPEIDSHIMTDYVTIFDKPGNIPDNILDQRLYVDDEILIEISAVFDFTDLCNNEQCFVSNF